MAKYKAKNGGAIFDAIQWQPGTNVPGILEENQIGNCRGMIINPGDWVLTGTYDPDSAPHKKMLVVPNQVFNDQYEAV